ncbi:MAG TPA: peptidoglycan DD-metalloendopeptidase family protein [Solirubrobacterales bacterium]|nr:peptidoglycan DD-metalloendopeptidase family protein [Solirubrobacterales bacterium]
MARSRAGTGPWLGGSISIFALAILIACSATPAFAATGGAPTPSGSPPPPPSHSGSPDPAPSAGNLSLISAKTWPRKSFYYSARAPRLRYEIGSDQATNDLRIDVVGEGGEVVKSYYRNDVAPETPDSVRWDATAGEGRPAPNGHYSFRIVAQSGGGAARRATSSASDEPLSLGFDLYGYAFPVLGAHDYGDAAARFGAPRSGHTHEGQDVMAACGTPLVAARGGRVQYSGYEGAAGNYLVIDGKGTGYDFAYMHLLEPSPLQAGMTVRTGEPIGVVGETGDATACHLHFEIWTAPGWYEGGSPIDPLPFLKQWDSYS